MGRQELVPQAFGATARHPGEGRIQGLHVRRPQCLQFEAAKAGRGSRIIDRAKALATERVSAWIPAFAGMTTTLTVTVEDFS